MDRFVDRIDFELIQMDTDSLYFALSAEAFIDVIRPKLRVEYDGCKKQWLSWDLAATFALTAACCLSASRARRLGSANLFPAATLPGFFAGYVVGTLEVLFGACTYGS